MSGPDPGVDLFVRYATIVIDGDTYQTNSDLRALADRIAAAAGIEPRMLTRSGMTVWRDHTVAEVFETDNTGNTYMRAGAMARRRIRLPGLDELTGDNHPHYVDGTVAAAGGGSIVIYVALDTERYIAVGTAVRVVVR